jgi:luciferase family oxidoreductase group 1
MAYRLSLLDKSPIDEGESAEAALERTVALALRAEGWGFHRFWVAEHHNNPLLASSSPEVLIAYLAARTSRIRIGSGGVMLQHYSPYKVAENFNLLAALAPGRVDLGVGRAPGGLPLATRALQGALDPGLKPPFAELLRQLDAFTTQTGGPAGDDGAPPEQPGISPRPAVPATRFLLGASVDSATLAGSLGWDYVHASHINGDEAVLDDAFAAYRRTSGGRLPLLAVAAIAAPTEHEARLLAGDLRRFRVVAEDGQSVTVGSLAQANEYIRQAGGTGFRIEEKPPGAILGTAAQIHDRLDRLSQRHRIREFIIDTPLATSADRLASIERIATAHFAVAA